MSGSALLDTSAWHRLTHPDLPAARRDEILDRAERGVLVVCLPVVLEGGYSARDARTHEEVVARLLDLPWYDLGPRAQQGALDAQRELARAGHHRLAPVDLMIAAVADEHRCAVLHYDTDYDLLARHTSLRFESEWLAERGTLR
ncbi:MAG: PIN domain-containing protein [Actinomycetota bacterium]|nr:PIN domain-containing protein [Solirubrobacterales bacterium]MBA3861604.1 PIN domain-containing protein [Solirubrobacterales bacterium]MDQ3409595.1 PIN domain-containing protein [Actinomycetota bacterium]